MNPTLLLNATYEPLQLISWQKALTLICLEKVEPLAHYEDSIRNAIDPLLQPAVVRLRRRVPWQNQGVRFSRRHVFQRDTYTCQYCGHVGAPKELTFDHVVPRSRGGETNWNNIVTCCRDCNQRKGDRLPHEANLTLSRRPVAPRWLPPQVKDNGTSAPHPLWEPYLWWAA
jgi:5-methylcytosine-specific restriction endonuclease McrA